VKKTLLNLLDCCFGARYTLKKLTLQPTPTPTPLLS
jgi:hypothetical protein